MFLKQTDRTGRSNRFDREKKSYPVWLSAKIDLRKISKIRKKTSSNRKAIKSDFLKFEAFHHCF